MGKSVGRLLASKGANVVIVARNVDKLQEAIAYISVSPLLSLFLYVQPPSNYHPS